MFGVWCNSQGDCSTASISMRDEGIFLKNRKMLVKRHAESELFVPNVQLGGFAIVALGFNDLEETDALVDVVLPEPFDQVLFYGGLFLCCGHYDVDGWVLRSLSLSKFAQCLRNWMSFREFVIGTTQERTHEEALRIKQHLHDSMEGIMPTYVKSLATPNSKSRICQDESESCNEEASEEVTDDEGTDAEESHIRCSSIVSSSIDEECEEEVVEDMTDDESDNESDIVEDDLAEESFESTIE